MIHNTGITGGGAETEYVELSASNVEFATNEVAITLPKEIAQMYGLFLRWEKPSTSSEAGFVFVVSPSIDILGNPSMNRASALTSSLIAGLAYVRNGIYTPTISGNTFVVPVQTNSFPPPTDTGTLTGCCYYLPA